MVEQRGNKRSAWMVVIAAAILIGVLDGVLNLGQSAALLYTLVFWLSIAQGCIVLVAISDLALGRWTRPLKPLLLSVTPMLLLGAVLFLFLGFKMEFYHHAWPADGGFWFKDSFFLTRNGVMLFLCYLVAERFKRETMKVDQPNLIYPISYIVMFVVTQSLIAFDWVMTLEYPWFSTLFGGYFFAEAIYMALAAAGILLFVISRLAERSVFVTFSPVRRDIGLLMFGFSIVCAGFFFSQFLPIWYGNLPEESSYIIHRLDNPVVRPWALSYLAVAFLIPFILLVAKKPKVNPLLVLVVSLFIMVGILIERWVMLAPVVPLNPAMLVGEFVVMAIVFALLVRSEWNIEPADDIAVH